MSVEFIEFVSAPKTIKVLEVTDENIEKIAVWMGADSYSIETNLVGGERVVTFIRKNSREIGHSRKFVHAKVGEYLLRIPEGIDEHLRDFSERFFSVTRKQIDEFVKQQKDHGHVDVYAPPYDR